MNEENEELATAVAGKLMAFAVGTGVGTAWGGPVGGLAGGGLAITAEAALTDLVRKAWSEVSARHQASPGRALGEAATSAKMTPEEVLRSALSTPEGTELLSTAILAATRTVNEERVRALGRAIGNGVADDQANIDVNQWIVSALADMETAHLRVLRTFVDDSFASGVRRVVPSRRISDRTGIERDMVVHLMRTLQRLAVTRDAGEEQRIQKIATEVGRTDSTRGLSGVSGASGVKWGLTPFGDLCVRHIFELPPPPPPRPPEEHPVTFG